MKVAVIGAGPSGLVTLRYLLAASRQLGCEEVEARLFELQPHVGGTFAARVYEGAELVSSKQLTTFSDYRSPYPEDFLSAERYVEYLNSYATHHDLWPNIKLRTKVIALTRRRNGGHLVTYTDEETGGSELTWECDAVAVCSGLHVEPNVPFIKGIENVPLVFHSSQFKERKQFGEGKTVLVVGTGETGADLGYLAVTASTARVLMSHRDGMHFAPKRNPGPVLLPILGRKPNPNEPGIPIDVSRANLFDTTYVPYILRNSDLLWEYYNIYIKSLLWLSSGATAGMDQWAGEISKARHHPSKIFFNKSMKVCPYISEPYRPKLPGWRLWIYALRSALVQTPIPDTCGKRIDLAPWPEEFDSEGVVRFKDNGREEYHRLKDEKIRPDIVVLCTGYKQTFPFLHANDGQTGQEYPTPDRTNVRGIWKDDEPDIGFVGFIRPSLGAIPPLSELQAQLWVLNLLAPQKIPRPLIPRDEPHYRLQHPPGSRVTYGVDHESYAYQLALDMDSAPGISDIFGVMYRKYGANTWRLPIIWALGAHFTTKFRLQGPWQWDGAQDLLVTGEFWETITRRPIFFGHFAVNILPIVIFGPVCLLFAIYGILLSIWEEVVHVVATAYEALEVDHGELASKARYDKRDKAEFVGAYVLSDSLNP
ncbi:dimethylaniline monooxygenase [Rhodocollybia butyracea]|uniref:Dimethylaniline monooxygenase n=1 Tax=Rhodocollybia butyracea TaxID=206335 RepID=A0A9P5PXS6_9AGAR|nr:dimethylaniline monooxygenase [Rhodocollybia butyracea]